MAHGKKYRKAAEMVIAKPFYTLNEALELLHKTGTTKFDATAELHMRLNVDPKQADQNIRGTVVLPHGSGKQVKIAAVVSEEKAKLAKAAGAVAAGSDELIEEFNKGKFNYDIIIATPDMMKSLAKVAKTLGQKGMMPNPKSGTVTDDVEKTIKELMRGRVEYRNDKEGNVHTVFGKMSFKPEELENNLKSIMKAIRDSKPASVKGNFVESITICGAMGPGIHLSVNETLQGLSK